MKDCKVTLTVKDDMVNLEGRNISMVELTELCGILQVMTGVRALVLGSSLDDVQDNLLDVHLAAMRVVASSSASRRTGVSGRMRASRSAGC